MNRDKASNLSMGIEAVAVQSGGAGELRLASTFQFDSTIEIYAVSA
jgi:hypothetical protein